MTLWLCNNRNSPIIIILLIITVIMIVQCTHKTLLTVLIVLFIIQCPYSRYAVICKILILVAQKDNIFKMIQCISPQFTPIMIQKILFA